MLGGRSACRTGRSGFVFAAVAVILTAAFLTISYAPPAKALPSYARQTGQPCGTCHTEFAGLTPYGRRFKIEGYTLGGGPYRTNLFPDFSNSGHGQQQSESEGMGAAGFDDGDHQLHQHASAVTGTDRTVQRQ